MPKKVSGGKTADLLELEVRILSTMWYKNGWGIFNVEMTDSPYKERTVIVGNFDKELLKGEEYTMYGTKEYNQKYKNEQYKIVSVKNRLNTPDQVRSFLHMLTKNDKVVDQLVQKYGTDVIDAIAESRIDHNEINGLGEKTLNTLRDKLMENLYLKDIVAELAQYDVSPNQMKKIAHKFGPKAVSTVRENPYNLCKIRGIGFKKADEIAQKVGVPEDSPYRIKFAIMHVLQENQQMGGHTWMDHDEMIDKVRELTDLSSSKINAVLNDQQWFDEDEITVIDGYKISLTPTYKGEKYIAQRIIELQKRSKPLSINVDAYVEKLKENYPTITDEQIQIFYNFAKNNVNILRGYAGCGKTWVTKLVVDMVRTMSIMAISPTGKASKVLEENIGMPTSTIHRAIGFFKTDDDESDDDAEAKKESFHDVVIVDEKSMCDVFIEAKLLYALKNPNVRLLFIGDDFQLPSVGCGNILHDIIESGEIPVTTLTKVFRQADGGILDIATKVRMNEKFISNDFPLDLPMDDERIKFGNDMIIHPCSQEYILDGVTEYYGSLLANGVSQDDILILSPSKIGKLGTGVINKAIQEIVNPESPHKEQIVYGRDPETSVKYRVGDRVINIKNNYNAVNVFDQEVTIYNGDMGVIKEINQKDGFMLVDYGFDTIKTSTKSLDTIIHSYALTIHKSQGSGFKHVILVTDKSHKFQLNANLVYTGITRSKESMVWLCQPDCISHAMNKNAPSLRKTFLRDMLIAEAQDNKNTD